MTVTASQLRQDVYRLLDEVLTTGKPLEIERHGKRLRIVPVDSGSRVDRIATNPHAIVGDPDDLVHVDWSAYWQPNL